jgi:Zn-dependent peptidase ImmA (M78 family)
MALNKEKIQKIEALTRDLLVDAYGGMGKVSLPVNLEAILANQSLKLEFFDGGKDQDLKEVDGAFNKDKRTIFLSSKLPYPRAAFTIAHELGHYFLHDDRHKDIFYRKDAINLGDPEDKIDEQEANWFAASLLMPKELIDKYWPFLEDINAISDKFYVSSSAAFWRLKNLGLI